MNAPLADNNGGFILAEQGVTLGNIAVRLARTPEEVAATQRLRYDIFYREYGAKPVGDMEAQGRDYDQYDDYAEHLIVIDESREGAPEDRIVGTYRLLRSEQAKKIGRFYSESEFNIDDLLASGLNLVEVGRSCVHRDYRTRAVLQLLWQGIAEYVGHFEVQVLFGCASFHGVDISQHANCLSFLHHFSHAPEGFCPRALPRLYNSTNLLPKDEVDTKRALADLPPLIKGYLRLGGFIGDGAIIDEQFNTIDVSVVVKIGLVSDRYRKHYERKTNTSFGVEAAVDENVSQKSEII